MSSILCSILGSIRIMISFFHRETIEKNKDKFFQENSDGDFDIIDSLPFKSIYILDILMIPELDEDTDDNQKGEVY
jgi:hypothetical protein